MSEEQDGDYPLPAAAAAALSLGRIVDAIKHVREAEGLGLMEAKQRVEAYIRRHPGLQAQVEEQQRHTRRRVIGWALAIDAILVVAVLWWFFGR